MIKKIKNKSSIIRIIISDFDDKGIKEIKVLYNKQGGVDTFEIGTKFDDNGELIFTKCKPNRREKEDKFKCDISEDGKSITISKTVFKKETRRYEISEYQVPEKFEPREKNKIVSLQVEDLLHEEIDKRRRLSHTQRKLLDSDLVERYSQIAQVEKVSSKDIYKIKRFLSYRSNMLIYFQFINDFLTKGTEKDDIYKFLKFEEDPQNKKYIFKDKMDLEKISENLIKNISIEIKIINNRLKKNALKSKKAFIDLKIEDKENMKIDVENTVRLFIEFRHRLMHYDYKFFELIFEGKNIEIPFEAPIKKDFNNVLDLNFFRELKKIKNLKDENKTNYLKDEDTLRILGKEKNAKKLYNIYSLICNRKSGFNRFVNSCFVEDGIENEELKKEINKHFDNRIEFLEKVTNTKKIDDKELEKNTLKKMEKELIEKKEIKNLIGQAYYWDIHQCKEYKKLYCIQKELVFKNNNLINKRKNENTKNEITKINQELFEIKNEMEKITKLNSKMRLEYKMQMAFGFLLFNFKKDSKINVKKEKIDAIGIDVNKFKDKFDPTKLEEIKKYKENVLDYLTLSRNSSEKKLPIELNLGNMEKAIGENEHFLSNNPKNNLSKFYILMYLLIPRELRGDFLGFVKKHYYDIKNIDFIEYIEENKNNDNKDEMKDTFFHNLRLFEKNSKDFEIIKYGIVDYNNLRTDFDRIYEIFELDPNKTSYLQETNKNEEEKNTFGLFDKNIILPIMKYYQHIFKLLNDVEIHALFYYSKNENIDLSKSIENIKKMDRYYNFNFTNLIKEIKLDSEKFSIRNDIAHLDYNNLFLNSICGDLLEKVVKGKKQKLTSEESKYTISERIEFVLDEIKKDTNFEFTLGMDFVNDFYQRKEQFIFNQKLVEDSSKLSTAKELEKNNTIDILNVNRIAILNKEDYKSKELTLSDEILDKVLERSKELMLISSSKNLSKENLKKIVELKVYLKKGKNEEIKYIRNLDTETIDKICGRIALESSNLLGIYKKYIIKNIKTELIKLFTKGEKRYLKLELCNISDYGKNENKSKFKDEFIIEFKEESNGTWDEMTNPIYIPNSQENIKVDKIEYNHYSINITTSTDKTLKATYKDGIFSMESLGKILERNILHGAVKIKNSKGKEEEKYQGIYYQNLKIKY